jgi:hypothetical protein
MVEWGDGGVGSWGIEGMGCWVDVKGWKVRRQKTVGL